MNRRRVILINSESHLSVLNFHIFLSLFESEYIEDGLVKDSERKWFAAFNYVYEQVEAKEK